MSASRTGTPRRSTRSQSREPEGVELIATSSALLSPPEKQAVRRKARTTKPKKVIEETLVEEETDGTSEVNGIETVQLVADVSAKHAKVLVAETLDIQRPRKARIRLRKLAARVTYIVPYLTPAFITLAILLLLAVPTPEKPFKRNVYVDENALQPGSASVEWNWGEVEYADGLADRIRNVARQSAESRAAFLTREIGSLGMTAHNQSYRFVTPSSRESFGINTYTRWSAARGDGRETFVIAAAWKSAWDGSNDPDAGSSDNDDERAASSHASTYKRKKLRKINVRGIATALTIARHLMTFGHWSKDILFVFADEELEGMQAWASKYFGREQSNLLADELHVRGSQVWNALAIDYPSDSFSHIVLKQEGLDGQLPNLDVVSAVTHLMHRAGSVPVELAASTVDRWPHRPLGEVGDLAEKYVFRGGDGARKYLSGLFNVLYQFGLLSSGKPSGIHGLLHRYHVDAITIFAYPAKGPYGFWHMGRAVESFTRSMSNLLERLHHSHFFYVLTSPQHFVEVAKYLPIAILFSLALLVQGLRLWYEEGVRGIRKQERLIDLLQVAIDEESAEEQQSNILLATTGSSDVPLHSPTVAQRTGELVSLVVSRASQRGTLIGSTKVRSIVRLLDLYGRPYGPALTIVLLSHALGVIALIRANNTAVDCAASGVERCYPMLQISGMLLLATTTIPFVIKRSSSDYFYEQLEAVQNLLPESALISAFRLSGSRIQSIARVAAALCTIEAALIVFAISLVNFSLAAVLGFVLSTTLFFCRLPQQSDEAEKSQLQSQHQRITHQSDRLARGGTPASDDSQAVEQEIVSEGRQTSALSKITRTLLVVQAFALLLATPTNAVVSLKYAHLTLLPYLPSFALDVSLIDRLTDGAIWRYQILSSILLPIVFLAYLPILATAAIASLLFAFSR